MNRNDIVHGFARIDNGTLFRATLTVITQIIRTDTMAGSRDPNWSHVDDHGHVHAYSVEGEPYPTLERFATGPKDEDGWAPSVLRCILCKERITPGSIPGPTFSIIAGPTDWAVSVGTGLHASVGCMVSVLFSAHAGGKWFGLGLVDEAHESSEGSTSRIRSAGELGRMKA